MIPPPANQRLCAFAALFAVGFAVLGVRLIYVHAIRPHAPASAEDSLDHIARPALRGNILSRDEKVLTWSEARVNIQADPVVLGTNVTRLRAIAEVLARELGTSSNALSAEALIPLLTPHAETRRWATFTTNYFETVYDSQNRPLIDATGHPLVRPVLATNWQVNPQFTNRAVVLFSNVPPSDWRRIRTNLLALKFPEQLPLQTLQTSLRRSRPNLWRRITAALGQDPVPVLRWRAASRQLSQAWKQQQRSLREVRFRGLIAQPVELRIYPHGTLAAHVLGYTTNDDRKPIQGVPYPIRGATGIEHMLDDELTGSPGLLVTHAAKGRELVRLRERDLAAQDGLSVQLTLDSRIQAVVENALDEGYAELKPKTVTAIVVRPSTGEILALANRPAYDPNRLREAEVDHRWNRSITAPTEPGSTFKICTYATALDLGRITLAQTVNCEGGRWSPGVGLPVNDVEGHGLGVVSLEEAFARSSNVAAAKIGLGLSANEFVAGMERFGFLHRTGIFYRRRRGEAGGESDDWGGENAGGIPTLIRGGRIGTELHGRLSYGYGLYVTPLQTAFAVAALANDGVLMKPLLVRELRTPEGRVVKHFEPTPLRQAVSPETAKAMLRAMRRVVTTGTGKMAALSDYEVAGKTGTTHKQYRGQQSNEKYVSTFVGVLPADKPELCILVLADETTRRSPGAHFGGRACGPIFTNIATRAAGILALRPTEDASEPATTPAPKPAPEPTPTPAPTPAPMSSRETTLGARTAFPRPASDGDGSIPTIASRP